MSTVPVSSLFRQCSYPMRPDAIAMSDTCRQSASTAVRAPDGALLWRCPAHKGMLPGGKTGEVVTHVVDQ